MRKKERSMVPVQQNKALVQLDDRRALTAAQFHQLADVSAEAEWFANIATTRIYDRRRMRPEDSPTFKVSY